MTRIISGFAGSRTIAVPSRGTRPTSDRVREAIFSVLDARNVLDGARVLDLYAGSGALGLEAASRGARAVTLVESNFAAAQVCRKNAAIVEKSAPRGTTLTITVSASPVHAYLTGSQAYWDVVFVDPPYDLGNTELAQALTALEPRLHEDSVVLLERGSRMPVPDWPDGLELERRKDYGDTTLYWLGPARPPGPTDPA